MTMGKVAFTRICGLGGIPLSGFGILYLHSASIYIIMFEFKPCPRNAIWLLNEREDPWLINDF